MYFDDVEKQKQLKIILDSWLDTPWRHRCGVKGEGTDCIHFVARVYEEMGILLFTKKMVPAYPKDWHLHNTREVLVEEIKKNLNVVKVNLSELKTGDMVLSHYGKAASHAAIYYEGYLYQSITSVGVCKINFKDGSFKKKMRFGYRITG